MVFNLNFDVILNLKCSTVLHHTVGMICGSDTTLGGSVITPPPPPPPPPPPSLVRTCDSKNSNKSSTESPSWEIRVCYWRLVSRNVIKGICHSNLSVTPLYTHFAAVRSDCVSVWVNHVDDDERRDREGPHSANYAPSVTLFILSTCDIRHTDRRHRPCMGQPGQRAIQRSNRRDREGILVITTEGRVGLYIAGQARQEEGKYWKQWKNR